MQLKSSWIDPGSGEQKPPIVGYAAIRQSLTSLSLRLMTEESRSKLVAHSIEREEDGVFRFSGIYRNEPNIELQGVSSEIHHGAFSLDVIGTPAESMLGHYWTDRETKGAMKLGSRRSDLFETYEQAAEAFRGTGT